MEHFDRKIHIKNQTEIPDNILKTTTEAVLNDQFNSMKKNSVDIESILGRGSMEKLGFLYRLVNAKFVERGIPQVPLFPVLFDTKKASDIGIGGRSYPFCVEIFDMDIEDESLKQLVFLKNISHELYHCGGRISTLYSPGTVGTGEMISMEELSTGASFKSGQKDIKVHEAEEIYTRAFEEGAAVQFETELFEEVKKMFPEETIQTYNKITQHAIARVHYPDPTMKAQEEQIRITECANSGEYKFSLDTEYFESKKLVEYLSVHIPNFFILLEDARVNGKIIPLGKAIDTKFGAGWYRRITTATTSRAAEILEELKRVVIQ